MKGGLLARAGALAGAGALAAAAPACRRQEPPRSECFHLDVPRAPVGFDSPFAITARLDCPDLRGGRVSWRQVDGPSIGLAAARDGFELTARMPPLTGAPWGVVPLSPRTRGEVVLRATWADDHGHTLSREARIAAAHRSRGLPNTPVDVRVYLGGRGWHVTARPAGSNAALVTARGVTSLLPDVAGDWRLEDGTGRPLALRTGRYDETPLDCGRSGCHPAITDATAASPMTTVLARLMDLNPRPAGYPTCALACHATGEPGAHDGGFTHVASELGNASARVGERGVSPREPVAGGVGPFEGPAMDARRWDELPRDLHRLGGVGCLACHGPGAIPETAARWSVLRADVCAVCHDAPPRYGHVAAWRQTAMARADQNPRARGERACARCHTTSGFLEAVSAPEREPVDRRAPDGVGPVGISCAACHAVHDPKRPPGVRRLLRATPTPALLAGAAGSVCLPCHTPDADDVRPSASAAALWLGRGGLDVATGQPVTGAAPHAGIAGGCVGCHRSGPGDVERGAGHGFRAPASVCTPCHGKPPQAPDIRARALQLWRSLRKHETPLPAHAGDAGVDRRTPLGRATWNLLLVLEDPGAAAHNPGYANALLDTAASVIDAGETRKTR